MENTNSSASIQQRNSSAREYRKYIDELQKISEEAQRRMYILMVLVLVAGVALVVLGGIFLPLSNATRLGFGVSMALIAASSFPLIRNVTTTKRRIAILKAMSQSLEHETNVEQIQRVTNLFREMLLKEE